MWDKFVKLPEFMLISRNDVRKILDGFSPWRSLSGGYVPHEVLDMGMGYGRISHYLKSKGFNVTSIDTNEEMLRAGMESGLNCHNMDAAKTTFKDKSFDLVITDGLLEHLEDCEPILKEQRRLSRKWVLNFVPKDSFANIIFEKLQRVPAEHRKPAEDWLRLHMKFFPVVKIEEMKRLLAIQAEVGK